MRGIVCEVNSRESPRNSDENRVSQGHECCKLNISSFVPSSFSGVSWGLEAAASVHRVSWRQVLE